MNNKDNVEKKGKIIVGGTLREKLKARLKEIIRQQMKEISTSSAAGPYNTPHAFGKSKKDPTTGLDGYKQVGNNETGAITEKEDKKSEKSEKEPAAKKSEPKPYEPIVKPKTPEEKAAAELSPENPQREKKLAAVIDTLSDFLTTRRLAKKAQKKHKKSD